MNKIQHNVPLAEHTTLKVGGPAAYFVTITDEAELSAAVAYATEHQMPYRVIGGGSNILASDEGLPGLTIKNEILGIDEQPHGNTVTLTVGAGVVFDDLVAHCVENGYWGLENLSHIPGSVGATPVQNVGAYGVEIQDYLTQVRVLNTETREFATLAKDACQFAYRESIFKIPAGKKYIISSVTFTLSTEPQPKLSYRDLAERFGAQATPSIQEIRDAVIAIRAQKFPDWHRVGTAGSFFKNPVVRRVTYERLRGEYPGLPGFDVSDAEVKIPLGWILDRVCGLRGANKGAVGTYQGQALVIINTGGATATEIEDFARSIIEAVFAKTCIKVEWEVTRLP